MSKTQLTQKEKELIAVGAAISAGCQKCSDFHFKKVIEEGASSEEVNKAVTDATFVINSSKETMQRKAYSLMNIKREDVAECCSDRSDRMAELVKIGAAVATNCTTNTKKHIELAISLGVSSKEIEIAVGMAKAIRKKAGEFADQAVSEGLHTEVIVEETATASSGCGCGNSA